MIDLHGWLATHIKAGETCMPTLLKKKEQLLNNNMGQRQGRGHAIADNR